MTINQLRRVRIVVSVCSYQTSWHATVRQRRRITESLGFASRDWQASRAGLHAARRRISHGTGWAPPGPAPVLRAGGLPGAGPRRGAAAARGALSSRERSQREIQMGSTLQTRNQMHTSGRNNQHRAQGYVCRQEGTATPQSAGASRAFRLRGPRRNQNARAKWFAMKHSGLQQRASIHS